MTNDAEKFTSEMHDPCARGRYLQGTETPSRGHRCGAGQTPSEG